MDKVFLFGGLIIASILLILAIVMFFVFKIKKQRLEMQYLVEYGKEEFMDSSQLVQTAQ